MNHYRMILTIAILAIVIAGCSNNPSALETNKTEDQKSALDANTDKESIITHDFKFPISDDPTQLTFAQSKSFSPINRGIQSYYNANGSHEDSLKTLINNGFLLFWGRNVLTGEPLTITGERFDTPNPDFFGKISYRKLNDDTLKVNRVYHRPSESGDWEIRKVVYPNVSTADQPCIVGCTAKLPSIDDSETRFLLAKFGQLTNFLHTGTDNFVNKHDTLPSSFHDLLGLETLLIKENFLSFLDLVQESDVEFKWGMDETKKSSYLYLKINGRTYIKRCIDQSEGNSISALKTMLSCKYDSIDTSSPILTEKNFSSIEIDDVYFVSRDSIKVQE